MTWLKKLAILRLLISDLVKKADSKISEIEKKNDHDHSNKYITTKEFNNVTSENFDARLKQTHLARKNRISDFIKKAYFDEKSININRKVTLDKTN